MGIGAVAVARGCGTRVSGGAYAECGLGEEGLPLEQFLIDPPMPVPPELPISPIGVQLIERGGTWHIVDWVGEQHYPNVADFVEEVRRFGMSRRLPKTLDFSKLTKQSRHILVHGKAWIENGVELPEWKCPLGLRSHNPLAMRDEGGCCAGMWYQDIIGTEGAMDVTRLVLRKMPSFQYVAYERPTDFKPLYAPAFFLSVPITRLVVVEGDESKETLAKMSAAQLPVEEVSQ